MKVQLTKGYLDVNYMLTQDRPHPSKITIVDVYHFNDGQPWVGCTNLIWLVEAINTAPEFESLRKVIYEAIEADFKKFQEEPEPPILGASS